MVCLHTLAGAVSNHARQNQGRDETGPRAGSMASRPRLALRSAGRASQPVQRRSAVGLAIDLESFRAIVDNNGLPSEGARARIVSRVQLICVRFLAPGYWRNSCPDRRV